MDNVTPTNTDNPTTLLNNTESNPITNDQIAEYYNNQQTEIEAITQDVENLTETYNKVNDLLLKNTYILENKAETITDELVYTTQETFLKLASDTPFKDRTSDAFDINTESFMSKEAMFSNITSNIVEFLKHLYKFIMEKLNQLMFLFKKARFKITTIIGKVITRADKLNNLLHNIQNKDKELFNKVFKGEKYEDLINDLIATSPGYYIGSVTLDDVLNFNRRLEYINSRTDALVTYLSNLIRDYSTKAKNTQYSDQDVFELWNSFIAYNNSTSSIKGRDWENRIYEHMNKRNLFDKKGKYQQVVLFDKDSVTYTHAVKPIGSSDEVLFTIKKILPDSYKVTIPTQLTYSYLFKLCTVGLGKHVGYNLIFNRDKVYNLLLQYNDFIELCNTMLKNVNRIDPDKLKAITMIINKNIYPIIYNMLMKQYVSLVLQYNDRINIAEKLLVEMNKDK